MAFRPRCRLPIGLTVTRVSPLEQDVGGLHVTSQRAVLPLLFDVDAAGKVRFERQPLPSAVDAAESRLALADIAEMGKVGVHPEVVLQSLLASAAFPVAFRPRVLCECAADCGPDPEARRRRLPGTAGHSAHRAVVPGALGGPGRATAEDLPAPLRGRRRLRQRPGGARAGAVRGVLPPGRAQAADRACSSTRTTAGSSRRSGRRSADRSLRGAGALLTFAGDLVQTARNRELSRAAQAGRWNLTTRRLLLTSSGQHPRLRPAPRRAPGPGRPAAQPGASSGAPRDPRRAGPARPHPAELPGAARPPAARRRRPRRWRRQCAGFVRGDAVDRSAGLRPGAPGPGHRAAVARRSSSS